MALFTSNREKRLWGYVLAVVLIIYSSLFLGQPLVKCLGAQNLQALLFLLGMLLVALVVVIYGMQVQPHNLKLVTLIGLAALFLMLFLRLGLAERSHLIEYGVLTVFIHRALNERLQSSMLPLSLWSALITISVSLADEIAQHFIPDRIFDLQDILFNGLTIITTLISISVLEWIRHKFIS